MRQFASSGGTAFYRIWCRALSEFLGWSEEKVWSWAKRFEEQLNTPDDVLYNKTPIECIADLLIPDQIGESLSADQRRTLRREIRLAIESKGSLSTFEPTFDWEAAKTRWEWVLKHFQASGR